MVMVVPETLKGFILTDFSYTWDEVYTKILMRDDLGTLVRITDTTSIPDNVTAGVWQDTTFDFIFPWKYDYVTILNGLAVGNVHVYLYALNGPASTMQEHFKGTFSLLAINSAGVERTLGSAAINEIITPSVGYGLSSTLDVDVPFFISLDSKEVLNTEKLVLRLLCQAEWTQDGGNARSGYVNLKTTLNSDDVQIIIPRLPKG